MADQQKYWMDFAYYGMRWLILPTDTKQFVVAAGETESNAIALTGLGFRRHPRQGYWLRAGMPQPRAIKAAFAHVKWYVIENPASVILRVAERSVQAEESPRDNHVAPLRDQQTPVGKGAAILLAQHGITSRLLASEEARILLRAPGAADMQIVRTPAPEGVRLAFYIEQVQPGSADAPRRVRVTLDGAGHVHFWGASPGEFANGAVVESDERGAARFFAVLLANSRNARVVTESDDTGAPATPLSTRPVGLDGSLTRIAVVIGTERGGESATVGVTRWRSVGAGDATQVLADVSIEREARSTTHVSALPVAAMASNDDDVRSLLLGWGETGILGVQYIAAPAHTATERAQARSDSPKEGDHAERSDQARDDAAGPSDGPVSTTAEVDRSGGGTAVDVSRSTDPQSSGDGPGARARTRRRSSVKRDDDAVLFQGLTERPSNYRLVDSDLVVRSTWNERDAVGRNLEAIRALKRVEASGGAAVEDADREALIRYVGWGGLPGVFAPGHHLATTYGGELLRALGEDGVAAARASTVNAHFTALPIVDALWAAIARAGFTGGRTLEPGAGTGLFMARVPEAVADATRFVAVEKEPVSGAILTALYPQARVFVAGYEETPIPNDCMDLVIGNVPFGEFRVYDEAYKTLKAPLHDYFLIKSLDKLRPGGVLACITSTGTLDKQNPRLREAMYEKADLIAARRLPNDAFSGNANTDVTADVVFFRKRRPDDVALPFDWRDLVEINGDDDKSQWVNGVFQTDRGVMLGHAVTVSSMFGGRNAVVRRHPKTGIDTSMAMVIQQLSSAMPEGTWTPATVTQTAQEESFAALDGAAGEFTAEQEGNYQVRDGRLGQIVDGRFTAVTLRYKTDDARVRAWIPVRDGIKDVLRVQVDGPMDDDALRQAQSTLALVYDEAVAKHGPASTRANRRAMADDPDLDILLAAEDFDEETGIAKKTEVFSERTLNRRGVMPHVETATDALLWCIDRYGSVIPDRIADAANQDWDECLLALKGQIFMDPDSGAYELAARYLSGNVRVKLRTAEQAAKANPLFDANVVALKERIPSWLSAAQIDANLGQPWIPALDVKAFVLHIFGGAGTGTIHVAHNPVTAEWALTIPKHLKAPRWGTARFGAGELIELALRGQMPKVFDKNALDELVLNPTQTAIAIERQKEIRAEFGRWIWSDLERSQRLEVIYNEKFRSHRSPDYSGIPVTVPGMAMTRQLRPRQARGVMRIVMEQNTLLAHPVGFGKTATMGSAAMKLKSLELANKSMIVVRKNTLYQAAAEVKRWFPEARVLMIRSEDLNPKGRMQFWRRVQMRNADIVLVTPEAFKRIRLPKDAEIRFLNEELSHIEMALAHEATASDVSGKPRTRQVKSLEKRRAAAKTKLTELLNLGEKDDGRVTIADLGIDALFVDEAQNYKNLQVLTREQMLGIPTAAAQRASDLASKVWFMQQNNKRVIFATGTPVVNTLAEIFNLQRYLSPGLLEEAAVHTFDAWVAQFGEPVASLEPDPGGAGFRTVRRLAEVRNVPELVAMFAQVTDAVADSAADFARPNPTFRTIVTPPTPLQSLYREVLAERVVTIRQRGRTNEPGSDNILAVLGDARRAALDLRTMYPGLGGEHAGGKLHEVATQVAKDYIASEATRGTQLVFLDFGTPGKGLWNAYAEIRAELIQLGVAAAEIAFIHDCKTDQVKADLFRHVREGKVRVLLGSTEKMGEGTNVQDRIVALHHVNAPFHPGAVIQRNGRGIRQGNQNKEIAIYTYVTQGLLEDWNWHLVLLKSRFIGQLMDGMAANTDGEGLARRMTEDPSASMSYEEIEAMASGDPLVKEKCTVDAEVRQLRMLRDGHNQTQGSLRYELSNARQHLEHDEKELVWISAIADRVTPPLVGEPSVSVNGRPFTGDKAFVRAGEAVIAAIDIASKEPWRTHVVANVMGLTAIMTSSVMGPRMELVGSADDRSNGRFQVDFTPNPIALVKRMESTAEMVRAAPAKVAQRIEDGKKSITRFEKEFGVEWPLEAAFEALLARQSEANIELERRNAQVVVKNSSAIADFNAFLKKNNAVLCTAPSTDDDMLDTSWGGDNETEDERSSDHDDARSERDTEIAIAGAVGMRG
ncbi:MAG: SNF2-related protein [Dokdonella sp.]